MTPKYKVYLDGELIKECNNYTDGLSRYMRAKNENQDKEVVFERVTTLAAFNPLTGHESKEQDAA